jgi:hypothetical protein
VFVGAIDVALISIGALAGNVLSNFGYQHRIGFHYSLIVVPALVFATVEAVARLKPVLRPSGLVVAFGLALIGAYMWGPLPFSRKTLSYWRPDNPNAVDVRRLQHEIPPGAAVSAYYSYVPHVDHRRRIYMFPTPFAARFWGAHPARTDGQTLTNRARDVGYVFIQRKLSPQDQAVWDRWKGRYALVRRIGSAVLYRRADLAPGVAG